MEKAKEVGIEIILDDQGYNSRKDLYKACGALSKQGYITKRKRGKHE